jgi:hypothetical protein
LWRTLAGFNSCGFAFFIMWQNEKYYYTSSILRRIAWCYPSIYDGIPRLTGEIINEFSIAEFKGDFDRALDDIGRGTWVGDIEGRDFSSFREFGQLQQVVIADIYGVPDNELEVGGFYQIPQLRGRAYAWMRAFLNGFPYGRNFIANSQKAMV